ncbi:MAG: ATP-binding protein [Caulobacterales bacterium]|nr:ATP-binding protein [Caulobacterales bacterium]
MTRLTINGVSESRTLEFKRELPSGSNDDKKEFLADVTAFANSHGGDLIYGVAERDGLAAATPGLAVDDPDTTRLRLENILRDGVEPRLAGVRMVWVPLASGASALVIRVPQSPAGPHRIKFANSGRFVARGGGGKYDMDAHELRQAFSASEALPERLRALHVAAVASATTGANLPFRIHAQPMAIVSLLPYGVLRETRDYDVTPETALAPIKAGGFEPLHLIEGVLLHSPLNAGGPEESNFNSVRSYALTHRRGRIDVAWTIGGTRDIGGSSPVRLVWPNSFEEGLTEAVGCGIARLRQYGVDGPWLIAASVSGLAEHHLNLGGGYFSEAAWRDAASLGDVLIEQPSEEALEPLLNAFWLAFGVPRRDA